MKHTKEHNFDEKIMRRCLDLAVTGISNVAPNPMVGAVIVKHGKIIGEGFHGKIGEAHAEVNAINSVTNKSDLTESSLYVNLEPCSHFGRTPPCAELIIHSGIPRVVIASSDPNEKVAGRGIEMIKNAGIEVITGILASEAMELNKRFFTYHINKRPWILLKWAQTLDGYIDTLRRGFPENPAPWITNALAKSLVHKWRTEESSIIVGTNTLIRDNPQLTVREWTGKNPLRLAIDRTGKLPSNLNIFNNEASTLIFSGIHEKKEVHNEWIKPNFETELIPQILNILWEKQITSLMVEGGNKLISNFLRLNLWDEARVFIGNRLFHEGIKAPYLHANLFNRADIKFLQKESESLIESKTHIGDSSLFVFTSKKKNT